MPDFLLDPLRHDFMVRALMISALVGGVCGLLSCYMTLKGSKHHAKHTSMHECSLFCHIRGLVLVKRSARE